jgi:hypothetical protein
VSGARLLLLRFPWRDDAVRSAGPGAEIFRSLTGELGHAYVALEPGAEDAARKSALASGPEAGPSLLALLRDVPGASAGAPAPYRYVVETDVEPAHEDDFNAWYDQEHLRGLAGVPGTVRARRFRAADGSPRYHACYDLVAPATLGSPPWLAVRATPWSDRVRPAFRNTRRTMFRRVA